MRLPEGVRDARFLVVAIENVIPDARVFFCHHFTPELVWRDEDRRHPNGVTDITSFAISSRDPVRGAAVFARVFGADRLLPTPGGLRLPSGQAEVLFLQPDEVARRYGSTAPAVSDAGDRMAALTFRVASPAATGTLLSAAGVPFDRHDGRLRVAADQACGVVLVFEA